VRWDYGPCDPNDPRSCHQSVRLTPDGGILTTETPNPGVSPTPKTRADKLAPAAIDALKQTVDADFVRQMQSGFPCAQPTPDASTTIVLNAGGKELSLDVTPCVRDEAAPNAPKRVVKIAEPYRFVK
jgi:hypothetical protein